MIRSALYHGDVMHQRFTPKSHRFEYSLSSWLIDIDELGTLHRDLRGFSWNKGALFSFHDSDYGFADGRAPRAFINDIMKENHLPIPERVELLCQIRCLGYVFNPLVVWFCYDANQNLNAVLYEVRNTFKQRHHYLVPINNPDTATHTQPYKHQADKHFYVSPFMPMECTYRFTFKLPQEKLALTINQTHQGKPIMTAVWKGQRQPLSQSVITKQLFKHPLNTLKVIVAIHWEALKLWGKGVKLVKRPAAPSHLISHGQPTHSSKR